MQSEDWQICPSTKTHIHTLVHARYPPPPSPLMPPHFSSFSPAASPPRCLQVPANPRTRWRTRMWAVAHTNAHIHLAGLCDAAAGDAGADGPTWCFPTTSPTTHTSSFLFSPPTLPPSLPSSLPLSLSPPSSLSHTSHARLRAHMHARPNPNDETGDLPKGGGVGQTGGDSRQWGWTGGRADSPCAGGSPCTRGTDAERISGGKRRQAQPRGAAVAEGGAGGGSFRAARGGAGSDREMEYRSAELKCCNKCVSVECCDCGVSYRNNYYKVITTNYVKIIT